MFAETKDLSKLGTSDIHETKTRNQKGTWGIVYCYLYHVDRDISPLFQSQVLENKYKKYLLFQNNKNVRYWMLEGLKDLQRKITRNTELNTIVFQLSKGFPLSKNDTEILNQTMHEFGERFSVYVNFY